VSNGRFQARLGFADQLLEAWLPENSEDSTGQFKGSGKNYFGVDLAESAYIFNIGNVRRMLGNMCG